MTVPPVFRDRLSDNAVFLPDDPADDPAPVESGAVQHRAEEPPALVLPDGWHPYSDCYRLVIGREQDGHAIFADATGIEMSVGGCDSPGEARELATRLVEAAGIVEQIRLPVSGRAVAAASVLDADDVPWRRGIDRARALIAAALADVQDGTPVARALTAADVALIGAQDLYADRVSHRQQIAQLMIDVGQIRAGAQ
jgi:hypothetical protein